MAEQTEANLDFLRQLEQSVSLAEIADSDGYAIACEPLRAFFSPFSAEPELNYVMPIAQPALPDDFVTALRVARLLFANRQRRLRLEFTEELWPSLTRAAQQAGLTLVAREPLMVCRPDTFQPAPPSAVSVALLSPASSDAELAAWQRILDAEFEDAPEDSEGALLRLRAALASDDDWYALATLDGQFVGTGRCDAGGANGWGEISAIITDPAFRRRGVALAVTSALTQRCFAAGSALAWLNAANPTAERVYARLGFGIVGTLLNYEDRAV
jgi:predicted GNAT family acetyltransferase